jgi:hypothetical protein
VSVDLRNAGHAALSALMRAVLSKKSEEYAVTWMTVALAKDDFFLPVSRTWQ